MFKKITNNNADLNISKVSFPKAGNKNQEIIDNKNKYLAIKNAKSQLEELKAEKLTPSDPANLLNYFKKFDKISFDCDKNIDPQVIKIAYQKLNNGSAQKLYNALINDWGFKFVELNNFLFTLAEGKESFYLNRNNIDAFSKLKEKYIITYCKKNSHFEIDTFEFSFIKNFEAVIKTGDFLCNETVIKNITKYFPDKISESKNKKVISVYNLFYFQRLKILQDDALEEIFEKKYGLSRSETKEIIELLSGDYLALLNEIKKPEIFETFNRLNSFFKINNISPYKGNMGLLLRSIRIKNTKNWDKALEIIKTYSKELNFDLSSLEAFLILYNQAIIDNLLDTAFIDFYKKVVGAFYNNKGDLSLMPGISRLYNEVNKSPKYQDLLFSGKYRDAISYLKSKYLTSESENYEIDPLILTPVLKISEHLDELKLLVAQLEKWGEKISANDLILLIEVIKRPGLKEYLLNKDKMLNKIKSILNTPSAPRVTMDRILVLEEEKNYSNKSKIEEEIKNIQSSYSERPSLNELKSWPSAQILRIVLLKECLKDKYFLNQLGRIILKDMQDITSEAGGDIKINKNGKLRLENVPSAVITDGGFINYDTRLDFTDNFSNFHCHAVKSSDMKNYLGPSGYIIETENEKLRATLVLQKITI